MPLWQPPCALAGIPGSTFKKHQPGATNPLLPGHVLPSFSPRLAQHPCALHQPGWVLLGLAGHGLANTQLLGGLGTPWGLKAIWQGMGKGAGGADVGRRIYPILSLCSVSFCIHVPHSLTPPQVIPLPKSTEQSIAQTSSGCLQCLHSHKPCLVLSEMCPLLAREGGYLRPLHHLRAGRE